MNSNRCNNCGGNYECREGQLICSSCGLNNSELTLVYAAYQKLNKAEFSEAEILFENIIEQYPTNHRAYWGRLLARYGIKYEQHFSGEMIPICYKTTYTSPFFDYDYKQACQYADDVTRFYYSEQAKNIDEARKKWNEKTANETPYDIFICCKDTDLENGILRTRDSMEARKLYTFLTDLGYRVFDSYISLRDKIGENQEPYILNAISNAQAMIVFGLNAENINSAWMENACIQYRKQMEAGKKNPNSLFLICDGHATEDSPFADFEVPCLYQKEDDFFTNLENRMTELLGSKKMLESETEEPIEIDSETEEKKGKKSEKKTRKLARRILLSMLALFLAIVVTINIFVGVLPIGIEDGLEFYWYDFGVCSVEARSDAVIADIPSSYKGHRVTYIGSWSFHQHNTLTHVEIPDSVEVISSSAFSQCPELRTVFIEEGVTVIGDSVFYDCQKLTSIELPDSVTSIGISAFSRCVSLKSIKIPSKVTDISDYMFSDCTGLTSVEIPNSVTRIGVSAFQYCENLTSITIPKNVKSIGSQAFLDCVNLMNIQYNGTTAEWEAIAKNYNWISNVPVTEIICSNGVVALD